MSALRGVAHRTVSAAIVLAVGLAGAAEAQVKIEPMGDWDHVSGDKWAFFVSATPNTRFARAYCIRDTLESTGLEPKLDAEAEAIGAAKDYACLRLGCKPQGHRHDFEFTIFANAPPLADKSPVQGGVSMRMRAPNEEPIVLFDRANQRDLSRDGNLELVVWDVRRPRAGAAGNFVQARVTLAASYAFLEQLAAKQKAEIELLPGEGMRGDPEARHAGRTVALSLARMADVLAELRRHCAQPRR